MTSKELNLKLIQNIPEVKEKYIEETSWQDGNDTGSHVVFADVLVPYIKEQLLKDNAEIVARIFDFIEDLLGLDDEYANEVIALSVIESLMFESEVEDKMVFKYAKPKTLKLVQEITG